MLTDELKYRILGALEVEPTAEQATAVDMFCSFMLDRDEQSVMLVRGCAGTGKTTLAAAFVKTLVALNQQLAEQPRCCRCMQDILHIPSIGVSIVSVQLGICRLSILTTICKATHYLLLMRLR